MKKIMMIILVLLCTISYSYADTPGGSTTDSWTTLSGSEGTFQAYILCLPSIGLTGSPASLGNFFLPPAGETKTITKIFDNTLVWRLEGPVFQKNASGADVRIKYTIDGDEGTSMGGVSISVKWLVKYATSDGSIVNGSNLKDDLKYYQNFYGDTRICLIQNVAGENCSGYATFEAKAVEIVIEGTYAGNPTATGTYTFPVIVTADCTVGL